MADELQKKDEKQKKPSKLPLVIGIVLALVGGGGGFYAVQSGLILGGDSSEEMAKHDKEDHSSKVSPMPDIAFVPIDPMVISIDGQSKHLIFRAQLEVRSEYKQEVEQLLPRVVDVLNNYLRALETEDLTDGGSLARLRAQMLRRVQVATGGGRINDLLIMEFVIN